jgi:hypothetical protein
VLVSLTFKARKYLAVSNHKEVPDIGLFEHYVLGDIHILVALTLRSLTDINHAGCGIEMIHSAKAQVLCSGRCGGEGRGSRSVRDTTDSYPRLSPSLGNGRMALALDAADA